MENELNYVLLGVAGILLHILVKIDSIKKKKKSEFDARIFFTAGWPTIMINLIIVLLADYGRHEIPELVSAGRYIAPVFILLGYTGQSLLHKYMGKAGDKLGVKEDVTKILPLLLLPLLLASCTTERKFTKWGDTHVPKAAEYCFLKFPVVPRVEIRDSIKPGDTVYEPGEIVWANCDSAYKEAFDEAVRLGQLIFVPPVPTRCPPNRTIHDTFFRTKTLTVVDSALVISLKGKLTAEVGEKDKYKDYFQMAAAVGVALLVIVVVGGYFMVKKQYTS